MTDAEDRANALQFKQLTEAVKELRDANKGQAKFNIEVVKFMSAVTTWGKVGILLWSVFAGLLVWAITKSG